MAQPYPPDAIVRELRRELDLEWIGAVFMLSPAEQLELDGLRLRRAERFARDQGHELTLEWLREVGGFSPVDVLELADLYERLEQRFAEDERRLHQLVPLLDAGRLNAGERQEYDVIVRRRQREEFNEMDVLIPYTRLVDVACAHVVDVEALRDTLYRGAAPSGGDPVGGATVVPSGGVLPFEKPGSRDVS